MTDPIVPVSSLTSNQQQFASRASSESTHPKSMAMRDVTILALTYKGQGLSSLIVVSVVETRIVLEFTALSVTLARKERFFVIRVFEHAPRGQQRLSIYAVPKSAIGGD